MTQEEKKRHNIMWGKSTTSDRIEGKGNKKENKGRKINVKGKVKKVWRKSDKKK